MRYHMYCQSYDHADWARTHFQALPAEVRHLAATADFSVAERRCPQGMPISRLMREACERFT
jgi:hypothetical protein